MNKKLVLIARLLLGIIFVVFGANGLMFALMGKGFIPMPPPKPEMGVIMSGFMATVYLMPLVKIIEIVAGILFLWGRYLNLAIVLICPIIVNILGIHLFVAREGLGMAIILIVLVSILIASRWNQFKKLLME